MNMLLFLIILLPLLLGTTAVWWLAKWSRLASAIYAVFISSSCFLLILMQLPLLQQGAVTAKWAWLPSIGINITLRLDALSAMFALLISGIGCLVFIYAYYYLDKKNSLAKLYSLLMLFMSAMLGIVLSSNIMVLLVFWELTSVSSFLLVAYWQRYEAAQRGARMALLVTGFGGLCLLGGFILLGQAGGSYQIEILWQRAAIIQNSAYFKPMMLLLLLGALTKSAQFPFHFWLPNAMAAPTPVSAYLHSATMVKAGIFLLLRLSPIFAGAFIYHQILMWIGLLTLCIGAFFAMFKEDLKGLLAYSTISHLGLMVCLIGVGTPLAIAAAIFHILNHAIFKAALFMLAGVVDHETGSRDLRKLSGLWQFLPLTATLCMVAAAAMAGVPFTNGFLSKELFFDALLQMQHGLLLWLLAGLATLAGVFAVAYSARLVHGVFFDAKHGKPLPKKSIHEPPLGMVMPALLLAILCLLIGILPALLAEDLVQTVSAATRQMPKDALHLALWHGINAPLVMSVIAMSGGLLLYFGLARHGRIRRINMEYRVGRWRLASIFEQNLLRLFQVSRRITKYTETGSLATYFFSIVCCCVILAAIPLWGQHIGRGSRELLHAPWLAVLMWTLVLIGCAMLLWLHHQRIKAVLISGAIGLVVTLLFATMSAPDLALTQITVDVVTTVLVLMGLGLLPQLTPHESSSTQRWRDALIATLCGLGLGWVTWLVLTRDHQSISWFFIQQSQPLGGGQNIVNVILVDFRGFDTFGEITVLGIAAIGALCMMDGMRMHGMSATKGLTYRFVPSPLMLRMTMSWVLPLALVVSVYLFFRGHNLPGGGFIAGLITALALIVQYIAHGQLEAERLIGADYGRLYEKWIGYGLFIALFTGMAAWIWQRPFLTSAHGYVAVPLIGKMHLASAAAFDVGVYVTVVGSTLLLISVLGDSRHSTMTGPVRTLS